MTQDKKDLYKKVGYIFLRIASFEGDVNPLDDDDNPLYKELVVLLGSNASEVDKIMQYDD